MCKKRMVMFGSIVAMVLAGVVGCGGVLISSFKMNDI